MAQFMLLLHDPPDMFQGISPKEMESIINEYRTWGGKLEAEGKLGGRNKLTDEPGRNLVKRGGEILVTDGPFAEAKELVGGYYIVRAASYDEAVEIAKSCPHVRFGRIEIRQVDMV